MKATKVQARPLESIKRFDDLLTLSQRDLVSVMPVKAGGSDDAIVEHLLRNVFVYAIVTCSKDVHIVSRGDADRPEVLINVRTQAGLESYVYAGENGRHFADKLFSVTGTPQGGSTSSQVSTRFAMELPAAFARTHGLIPLGADPYHIDIRVEYIRTFDGWAFTCRLLDEQRAPELEELGLSYTLQRALKRAITEPSGLILVSGPTGSGKSTLLNAVLRYLNDGTKSICTIENPVEYRLRGDGPIKQISVDGKVTFALALRSILRHDPDIILVGEIRDEETMTTAMRAAQTGHLVLSTIHSNSAAETISRALELTEGKGGRDASVLAETLKFVMAQRLLTTFEGRATLRELQSDEAYWLEQNGLGFVKSLNEVAADRRTGMSALVEAIAMTPDIKRALRDPVFDTAKVYGLACEQPQYETLASAGLRAVEANGCRLRDCMVGLETTLEAQARPSLRMRLAREHGLSLTEVSQALDLAAQAEDEGGTGKLGDFVDMVRSARNNGSVACQVA